VFLVVFSKKDDGRLEMKMSAAVAWFKDTPPLCPRMALQQKACA
jgi:hypothetical protein